jgi:hypothetical protein
VPPGLRLDSIAFASRFRLPSVVQSTSSRSYRRARFQARRRTYSGYRRRKGEIIDELEEALAALERDADERARATFDPTHRLRLEPDLFLEQQARREKALRMQDAVRPGRTTAIALRLDRFTLKRLKALAALRGMRYQTLLKQFVVERLYEEEKRAGIIDG